MNEENIKGFLLWFSREEWGIVIDGLMLEKERSIGRKSANPESNSNVIADTCNKLILEITEAAK